MRARPYAPRSGDAEAVDKLLDARDAGFVDLDRDYLVISDGEDHRPNGCLIWRPAGFVHALHCPQDGLAARSSAIAMINFALGTAQGTDVKDAVFLVDPLNSSMLRFVRELPGIVEQPGKIFTLDLKPKLLQSHSAGRNK